MKTYLCIGAGPGISLATAKRFGREGYRIVLASRSAADNIRLSEQLKDDRIIVCYETTNAADPAQVAALIEKYQGEQLEVVHYNAGVLHYDSTGALIMEGVEKQTPEAISSDVAINITGALVAISKTIPVMTARGYGTILLTSGGLSVEPTADLLTLSVGKAGIRTMNMALFEPLKAKGVHIASVRVSTLVASDPGHPGKIAEEFWKLHAQPKDRWTWETVYPLAN